MISFIDKDRLLAAIDSVMDKLTPEEQYRNHVGVDLLCVGVDDYGDNRYIHTVV